MKTTPLPFRTCTALCGATALLLSACGGNDAPGEVAPAESAAVESAAVEAPAEEATAEILFNGVDLTGWTGNPDTWSVEGGVIVGVATDEDPLPYNQFLIWEGEPLEDFELNVDLRLFSEGGNNSGIQYRSRLLPEAGDYVVGGYQCDMHPADWANGMLYEEKGRTILCKRGQKAVITPEGRALVVEEFSMEPYFDNSDWHTFTVIARGNHLVHKIDGVKTAEIWDHDEANRSLSGILAFQMHRGPAMRLEIRNVRLERLPPADLVPPEATPVPEDAPEVHPRPAGKGKGKGKGKAKSGD